MGAISELFVRINGDTAGLRDAMNRAVGTSTAMLGAVTAATAGIAAIGVKSVVAAGQLEQTEVAFATMLGSAEKAKTLLAELKDFAATTPFELTELQGATKSLLAFGVEAEDIQTTLRRLGDVSAGIGAPIGEIAQLYGKAKTQGRLFAEDINQLTGRGIPIIKELAAQFGVSEQEVKGLVEGGKIGFAQLELAFKNMTATGSQFGGMMAAQSQTLLGQWSNLKDAIGQTSVIIGQELIKAFDIKEKLAGVIEALGKLTAMLQSEGLVGALKKIFPPETQMTLMMIAGAITAALIPAIIGIGTAIAGAMIPLLPFIAAGAALGALAYTIYKNWEVIKPMFDSLVATINESLMPIFEDMKKRITEMMPTIKTVVSTAFKVIVTVIGAAFLIIEKLIKIVAGMYNAIKPVLDAVGKVFEKVFGVIAKVVQKAIDLINKFLQKKADADKASTGTVSGQRVAAYTSGSRYAVAAGSYAVGTDYVPQTGLYQLHRGEAVLTAEENKSRGGDIVINITGNTIASDYDVDAIGKGLVTYMRRKGLA